MKKYCPSCRKMVKVKKTGKGYYKCQECGHNIKNEKQRAMDLETGGFKGP